jgi:hypothetical protein
LKAIDIHDAYIGTVSSRVDGSVRLSVVTPELTNDQRSTVLGMHGKNVRVLVEPVDVPTEGMDVVESEAEPKTKSQRLRAVLFVYYKQLDNTYRAQKTFQQFYDERMEAFIDEVKESLEI